MRAIEVGLGPAGKQSILHGDKGVQCDHGVGLLEECRECGKAYLREFMTGLHVEGRRWFQTSAGNTYHSVRIFAHGELIASLPRRYGYGEGYLQSAIDWLKANGLVPADAEYGTRYLREVLGGTYSVVDVARERDL